jgi:hypothetical protein
MNEVRRLSPAQRAEIEAWENTALGPEDFEARVRAPWTDHEREDFDALVRWFRKRYPTAGERLRAIRHRMVQLRRRAMTDDR